MIRVGWLQDDPGYLGGAELTAHDLRTAAPADVEIVDCPAGAAVPADIDRFVVHNCMLYPSDPLPKDAKVIRFIHDERGPGPIDSAYRIFYSPLQRDHVRLPGELCPAPLDRSKFHPNGNQRAGAVHIGTFGNLGKGQQLLAEYAQAHPPLIVYGHGPFLPSGPGIEFRGALTPEQVPEVLQHAQRFVHLPTSVEGYGRGVAEAWASGCELVVNANVGCLYWLSEEPDALDTAAKRFWELTLNV